MKQLSETPDGPTTRDTRTLRRVVVESPYAGDIESNVAYARRAVLDSVNRGEAPIASHLLFPEMILDDNVRVSRMIGIECGLAWHHVAEAVVFYVDRGMSRGMQTAMTHCLAYGIEYEVRYLEPWVKP